MLDWKSIITGGRGSPPLHRGINSGGQWICATPNFDESDRRQTCTFDRIPLNTPAMDSGIRVPIAIKRTIKHGRPFVIIECQSDNVTGMVYVYKSSA